MSVPSARPAWPQVNQRYSGSHSWINVDAEECGRQRLQKHHCPLAAEIPAHTLRTHSQLNAGVMSSASTSSSSQPLPFRPAASRVPFRPLLRQLPDKTSKANVGPSKDIWTDTDDSEADENDFGGSGSRTNEQSLHKRPVAGRVARQIPRASIAQSPREGDSSPTFLSSSRLPGQASATLAENAARSHSSVTPTDTSDASTRFSDLDTDAALSDTSVSLSPSPTSAAGSKSFQTNRVETPTGKCRAATVFFGTPSQDEQETRKRYAERVRKRRSTRRDSLDLARRTTLTLEEVREAAIALQKEKDCVRSSGTASIAADAETTPEAGQIDFACSQPSSTQMASSSEQNDTAVLGVREEKQRKQDAGEEGEDEKEGGEKGDSEAELEQDEREQTHPTPESTEKTDMGASQTQGPIQRGQLVATFPDPAAEEQRVLAKAESIIEPPQNQSFQACPAHPESLVAREAFPCQESTRDSVRMSAVDAGTDLDQAIPAPQQQSSVASASSMQRLPLAKTGHVDRPPTEKTVPDVDAQGTGDEACSSQTKPPHHLETSHKPASMALCPPQNLSATFDETLGLDLLEKLVLIASEHRFILSESSEKDALAADRPHEPQPASPLIQRQAETFEDEILAFNVAELAQDTPSAVHQREEASSLSNSCSGASSSPQTDDVDEMKESLELLDHSQNLAEATKETRLDLDCTKDLTLITTPSREATSVRGRSVTSAFSDSFSMDSPGVGLGQNDLQQRTPLREPLADLLSSKRFCGNAGKGTPIPHAKAPPLATPPAWTPPASIKTNTSGLEGNTKEPSSSTKEGPWSKCNGASERPYSQRDSNESPSRSPEMARLRAARDTVLASSILRSPSKSPKKAARVIVTTPTRRLFSPDKRASPTLSRKSPGKARIPQLLRDGEKQGEHRLAQISTTKAAGPSTPVSKEKGAMQVSVEARDAETSPKGMTGHSQIPAVANKEAKALPALPVRSSSHTVRSRIRPPSTLPRSAGTVCAAEKTARPRLVSATVRGGPVAASRSMAMTQTALSSTSSKSSYPHSGQRMALQAMEARSQGSQASARPLVRATTLVPASRLQSPLKLERSALSSPVRHATSRLRLGASRDMGESLHNSRLKAESGGGATGRAKDSALTGNDVSSTPGVTEPPRPKVNLSPIKLARAVGSTTTATTRARRVPAGSQEATQAPKPFSKVFGTLQKGEQEPTPIEMVGSATTSEAQSSNSIFKAEHESGVERIVHSSPGTQSYRTMSEPATSALDELKDSLSSDDPSAASHAPQIVRPVPLRGSSFSATPTHRRSRPSRVRSDPVPSVPISSAALASLTTRNSRANEAYYAKLNVVVQRVDGPRPPSPSSKLRRVGGKLEASQAAEARADRARRRATGAGNAGSREGSMEPTTPWAAEDHVDSDEHRMGSGDSEVYHTPLRIRAGKRGVRWHKALYAGPSALSISEASRPARDGRQSRGSCMVQKDYALDRHGNVRSSATPPSPRWTRSKVTIKKIVYDDDEEEGEFTHGDNGSGDAAW